MGVIFNSVPVNSVLIVPEEHRGLYVHEAFQTEQVVRDMLISAHTGAYLRGVAKSYQLPSTAAPVLAFAVLRIAIGEIELAKLGSLISGDLQLANDQAQKIAQELERDLFAPISRALNTQVAKQAQQQATTSKDQAQLAGARNILNLKEQRQPPQPPPIR